MLEDTKVKISWKGIGDWSAHFLQENQLKDVSLWKKFVDVFRSQPDGENQGWRGEFWGKMMRAAVTIYEYTQDDELYRVLTDSVKDMLTTAEEDGRVSSYSRETEFDAWDIWCRKYVLLALEYYLEICKDTELKDEIVHFVIGCADCILEHIGDGKKRIVDASRSWLGINSSSVLEPIVRLYRLTGEQRYLDFATYIVEEGGAKGINIFELAYENQCYPYQYGVSKAYEMMSCFEGLLEYYYVTGVEKYKTAVVNFGKAVRETEVSVIGSCGATHELFDHTRTRQTICQDEVMQETCVTVTWMKLCAKLLVLTGDSAYADCMERSFYNAYLGAINTDKVSSKYIYKKFIEKLHYPRVVDSYLAFDSYSPLTPGVRGEKVGGNQLLPDDSYYGCCACIGAIGSGVFVKHAVLTDEEGIIVNFFEKGNANFIYKDQNIALVFDTEYPADGTIKIRVQTEKPIVFTMKVRVPEWSGKDAGYKIFRKEWFKDEIIIYYDMDVCVRKPEKWEEDIVYTDMSGNTAFSHCATAVKVCHKKEDDAFICLSRGPLVLAADSRSGREADTVFDFKPEGSLCPDKQITKGVPCLVKMKFVDKNGEKFYLVDYASAGHDWESQIAAWLPYRYDKVYE